MEFDKLREFLFISYQFVNLYIHKIFIASNRDILAPSKVINWCDVATCLSKVIRVPLSCRPGVMNDPNQW